jgi:hypothetical protein
MYSILPLLALIKCVSFGLPSCKPILGIHPQLPPPPLYPSLSPSRRFLFGKYIPPSPSPSLLWSPRISKTNSSSKITFNTFTNRYGKLVGRAQIEKFLEATPDTEASLEATTIQEQVSHIYIYLFFYILFYYFLLFLLFLFIFLFFYFLFFIIFWYHL